MTSFPVASAALQGRGPVKEGFAADLTVFDLAKVKDWRPTRSRAATARGKALRGPGYRP